MKYRRTQAAMPGGALLTPTGAGFHSSSLFPFRRLSSLILTITNLVALPYPSETGCRSHFFFLSQVARLMVREAAMMEFIGKRCRIEHNPRLEAKTREYTALPWAMPFWAASAKPGMSRRLQSSMFRSR
jgi:hypothetical protein